jgi:hypothetical protein
MSEEKSPLLNSAGAGGDGGKGNSKAAKVDVERLPGYDAHFGAVPKRRTYYFFSNVKWCAPPPKCFPPILSNMSSSLRSGLLRSSRYWP